MFEQGQIIGVFQNSWIRTIEDKLTSRISQVEQQWPDFVCNEIRGIDFLISGGLLDYDIALVSFFNIKYKITKGAHKRPQLLGSTNSTEMGMFRCKFNPFMVAFYQKKDILE